MQSQGGLLTGEEVKDPDGANGLTEHSGQSCSLYTHMKDKDEDGVQNNIDNGADEGGHHADLGKALGGDKGVHAQNQQHKDRTQNINAAVGKGIGQGSVTGTEKPQHVRREYVKYHRQ